MSHPESIARRIEAGAQPPEGSERLTMQIKRFTAAIFESDDLVEIRPLPRGTQRWVHANELAELASELAKENRAGRDIYFGANPRQHEGGRAEDVALARCLFADFDGVDIDEVRRRIDEAILPAPTVLVRSGHGVHAYWRLDEPMTDLAAWTARQQALIGKVAGADLVIHDPPRVMRLPGTMNVKQDPHVPCELVEAEPRRVYAIDEFPEPGTVQVSLAGPVSRNGRVIPEGCRNSELTSIAGSLRRRGQQEGEIRGALLEINHRCCKPPIGEREVETIARSVARYPAGHDHRLAVRGNGQAVTNVAGGEPTDDDAGQPISLGQSDPQTGRLVLSPKRTLPTAEAYVREFHLHPEGRTLHSYAGLLLDWRGNCYREMEDEAVRSRLHPWLHDALRYVKNRGTGELELVDFESNPTSVNRALDTIRAHTHLPATTPTPSWLDDRPDRPPALEVLPCRTVNLHIPTGRILEPTPALFATHGLDFDPVAQAPVPERWLGFLGELLEEDIQAWDLLQEWFGYCLTPDTSQQKMLLVVGPKRSGKGTIARLLTRLIGLGSVCGPTVGSLAGNFGLQPLIGKSLAIVSDARFRGENVATVVERLLCISGEDAITVDRKFKSSVTLKLPTRFMFLTNELPRLSDASGALAGRFLIVRFTKSFYGHEDPELTQKLVTELPGILNWALKGWQQLRERRRFVQPASVEDAVRDLEDLSSPVGAFVRDECVVGAGHRVDVDDLYAAWKTWCEREGRNIVSTKQSFGRDLAAAVPGVLRRRGSYMAFYEGIALRADR